MPHFEPRKIFGRWRDGFALDLQTLSSVYVGDDEYGHPKFDTKRTEMGELLYKLKYAGDTSAVPGIAGAAEQWLSRWKPVIDIIVPVPSSAARKHPPVALVAEAISQRLGIPLVASITRTRNVQQLKDVHDLDERLKLLDGLHTIDATVTRGKSILLFDDLYRSGATMNAITTALYEQGGATSVYALTITRTRSNR
jgi:predicted amidophosphoribosyltransferase